MQRGGGTSEQSQLQAGAGLGPMTWWVHLTGVESLGYCKFQQGKRVGEVPLAGGWGLKHRRSSESRWLEENV